LLADREDLVARAAAGALTILRNRASEAPLLRAFATRGPVVQERVAAALGEIRSTNAVPGMAALLPTTTDEALKVTLVLALGKTGDQRALPPLRKVLEQIVLTNNLPKAREAAFVALAAAGDKGAIPRAIQIITTAVVPPAPGGGPTFDDDFVRVAALRYLGAVGDRATGTTLLAAIKHGVTREMRLTVAEALGKLLGQPLRPVPDEDHRRYFVESLAPFPRPVLSPTGTVPGR
jgi:HEAT repeat protein